MRAVSILLAMSLMPGFVRAQDSDGAYTTAVYNLKQTVASNPRHPSAWGDLCRAYLALDQVDAALDACLKQIDVNPRSPSVYGSLGGALWRKGKRNEAIAAFQQQVEVDPENAAGHVSLGHAYSELGKYADAVPELEKAVSVDPNSATGREDLGGAYLALGQTAKGAAILIKLAQERPTVSVLNGVAYKFASHRARLDLALQYAETAVTNLTTHMIATAEQPPSLAALRQVGLLTAAWDTLGWVHFQLGNADQAEKFISASWAANPRGIVGDHRGQLYESRGQKQQAVDPSAGTIRAGKLLPDKASADFGVWQERRPAVAEANFLRGDERLRQFTKTVQDLIPPGVFPDALPERIARRVILSCPGEEGDCSIELLPAAAAVFAELNAFPPDLAVASQSLPRYSNVFRVGSGISAPVPTYKREPEYTREAGKNNIQGRVVLYVEVDPTGHTRNIKVIRSLGYGLDEKAIEAVSQWEFRPGMKDGKPVTVAATIEVNFSLLKKPLMR